MIAERGVLALRRGSFPWLFGVAGGCVVCEDGARAGMMLVHHDSLHRAAQESRG